MPLQSTARAPTESRSRWDVDLVLVVVGVRPDTDLLAAPAPPGAEVRSRSTSRWRTACRDVWAAGDCVVTHHRLPGKTYLPLGTTAHKQGRVAGENALGGTARYAGSLGTQVVKVFDLVIARPRRAAGPTDRRRGRSRRCPGVIPGGWAGQLRLSDAPLARRDAPTLRSPGCDVLSNPCPRLKPERVRSSITITPAVFGHPCPPAAGHGPP